MRVEIDGTQILDADSFHKALASALRLPGHYGANLDALWDVLSASVERPVSLVWRNSEVSQRAMGEQFARIVQVLERVKIQDEEWGLEERFDFQLA